MAHQAAESLCCALVLVIPVARLSVKAPAMIQSRQEKPSIKPENANNNALKGAYST
jgi:hypothetical protein